MVNIELIFPARTSNQSMLALEIWRPTLDKKTSRKANMQGKKEPTKFLSSMVLQIRIRQKTESYTP